ncbi:hypothetical protein [Brevundimonas sp.]
MGRIRELLAYAVAFLALGVGIAAVLANRTGADGAVIAAWVQAVGSIAAIVLVSLPVLLQHSLEVRQAKAVTLATAEAAWSIMQSVADRYINSGDGTSEWWVPQWSIMNDALAQCPIHRVGSAEATRAFIQFREHFYRAEAFSEPSDEGLGGFVGFIMLNAGTELTALKKALK